MVLFGAGGTGGGVAAGEAVSGIGEVSRIAPRDIWLGLHGWCSPCGTTLRCGITRTRMIMMAVGAFPFGQPAERVAQPDCGPKRIFVLGVYASAVHARWDDANGNLLVRALAVASEPRMFWRGEGVEGIVSRIDVPPEAGRLRPAADHYNGPSGRSLDQHYLEPLGLSRDDAWLCDLVPYSRMNSRQADAISRCYAPRVKQLGLPAVDWPRRPLKWTDAARRDAIAAELRESAAELVVTLGNEPLKWFAAEVLGAPATLAECATDAQTYGAVHHVDFESRSIGLLPLLHPRQVAGLGHHSTCCKLLHETWIRQWASAVRARF